MGPILKERKKKQKEQKDAIAEINISRVVSKF